MIKGQTYLNQKSLQEQNKDFDKRIDFLQKERKNLNQNLLQLQREN